MFVKVAARKKAAQLPTVVGYGLYYQSVSTAPSGDRILISPDFLPPRKSFVSLESY